MAVLLSLIIKLAFVPTQASAIATSSAVSALRLLMVAADTGAPRPSTTEATAAPDLPLAASTYATDLLSIKSKRLISASALFSLLSVLNMGCM
uniref:Putative secreted protein n=1 Tax=Ixodes ricinus TaxID=34613 RepID=A0A6B0UHC0_IXORI